MAPKLPDAERWRVLGVFCSPGETWNERCG